MEYRAEPLEPNGRESREITRGKQGKILKDFKGFQRILKDFKGFQRILKDFHGFSRILKVSKIFKSIVKNCKDC